MMSPRVVRRASAILSAVSLLSLFGSNLNLGYLAETVVSNYERVRDFIWLPLSLAFDVSATIKNLFTFLLVFVPAFLTRGSEDSRVAAVSVIGSLLLLLVSLPFLIGIDLLMEATGFKRAIDNEDSVARIVLMAVAWLLSPLLLALSLMCLSFFYWLVAFLLPHLSALAWKALANFESAAGFLAILTYFPYVAGFLALEWTLGNRVKVPEPDSVLSGGARWLSWEETKDYYRPVKDVAIVVLLILVASKLVFESLA